MFVSLRMIYAPALGAGEIEALVDKLQQIGPRLPGVQTCWAAPVSPVAVINAGQVVWRMTFTTESEALLASASGLWRDEVKALLEDVQVSHVGYRLTECQVRRTGPGIWRALVFRLLPNAAHDLVERLKETTLLLPKHVPEIRSWALSDISFSEGAKAFTYVWEQEYDDVAGLTGPYMTTPVHWGIVDAFFDAEYPEYIVDPLLVQTVGRIDDSILTPIGPGLEAAR